MGEVLATVSVVMRTYERPVMLARAIASVQNQTFTDWELVVVNNGGSPDSVNAVVNIASQRTNPGNIRVVHLPERVGMEEASNQGLVATDSQYFAIHDDDDSWSPHYLEKTVRAMKERPSAAAVVTGVFRIHETFRNQKMWPVHIEKFPLAEERLTFDGLIGGNTFPPIAALFRRSVLSEVGMYDPSLPVQGDWEFNLRAVLAGGFYFLPERLANYHTRTPESDSASGNSITAAEDLHKKVIAQLQERWSVEPHVNGVNKGDLSRNKQAENMAREASLRTNGHRRRYSTLVKSGLYALAHPVAGVQTLVRLVRRVVN